MIKKIVKYVNEEGFEFQFEPIEDSLKIKQIEKELCPICKTELEHINIKKENVFGCPRCKKEIERKNAIKEQEYEARYIIPDTICDNPFEMDDGLGDFYHWKYYGKEQEIKFYEALGIDNDTGDKIGKENPDAVKIDKYEHSGISYSVEGEGTQCRWDTSHCWAVWLPNKCLLEDLKIFKTKQARRKRCIELARQACEIFNSWANGEVYCIVKETYDKNKEYIDHDTIGGYYGYTDAEEALERDL